MALELNINGYFELHICNLGTEIPVEKEVELGVLDTLQQIETQLLMRQYDGLMKGGRVQGRQAVTSA